MNKLLTLIMASLCLSALTTLSAMGQTTVPFTFSGSSPVSFQMDSSGSLSAIGTFGTGTYPTFSGAGTRMFWYPGKAAFRAGYVSGTNWNDANIGTYSFAAGSNPLASGNGSIALGYGSATNSVAVSLGIGTASGPASVAMGSGTAIGSQSVALAGGNAMGNYSFALGFNATASGMGTFADGNQFSGLRAIFRIPRIV